MEGNTIKVDANGVWVNGNKIERVMSISIKNISPGNDMEVTLLFAADKADILYSTKEGGLRS